MKLLRTVIAFTATATLCLFSNGFSFEPKLVVTNRPSDYDFDGEVLKYKLYWTIFHVADSTSRAKKLDKCHYLFSGKTSTAGIASWFKSIEDKGYSIWNEKLKIPEKTFISQREGNYVRERIYTYDLKDRKVKYVKKKPCRAKLETKFIKIPFIPFQDMVTAAFYFRRFGIFKVGKETIFPLFAGGKFQNVSFKVVSKETLSTPFGALNTFKVVPSNNLSPSGDFQRKGNIVFWFTVDKRHIPVKAVADVRIGSVSAVLISAKGKNFDLMKEYEKQRRHSLLERFMNGQIGGN